MSVFWNRFIAASCLTGLVLGTGIAVLLRRAGGPWWLTALIQLGVCVPVGYYWGKVANRAR